jgi:hypothetical protein
MGVVLFWCWLHGSLVLGINDQSEGSGAMGSVGLGAYEQHRSTFLTLVFLRPEGRTFRAIGLNVEAMSVPRLGAGIVIGLPISVSSYCLLTFSLVPCV